jgi:hypothetical protein
MQDIKGDSSKWINKNDFCRGHFTWQEGFGAFSYSKSDVFKVIEYIKNQEVHHSRRTFAEEYVALLKKFRIEFNEQFLFSPVGWIKD